MEIDIKTFRYIVIFVASCAISYLAFSFIQLDFDFMVWPEAIRIWAIALGLLMTFSGFILNYLED